MKLHFLLALVVLAAACTTPTPEEPFVPAQEAPPMFRAAWDGEPDGTAWTEALLAALTSAEGEALLAATPSDVTDFCPGFLTLDEQGRAAFWVATFSAMAKLESNFQADLTFNEKENCNTDACRAAFTTQDGRDVISRGLLQLSQESANGYQGCTVPADNEELLHNPAVNLQCSVAIMARWVPEDGVIAKLQSPWRGGARYWSVLRRPEKLIQIQQFTKTIPACR
ncbi:MAG: transglycosylase [Parvularculaceae bacterium]|nr:transglycosylase [Parvularculaceae bacterium]